MSPIHQETIRIDPELRNRSKSAWKNIIADGDSHDPGTWRLIRNSRDSNSSFARFVNLVNQRGKGNILRDAAVGISEIRVGYNRSFTVYTVNKNLLGIGKLIGIWEKIGDSK